MKKFYGEFKTFIRKGNVIELAVAFIMGVSFRAIITSFVNDIIMPVISLIVGADGFNNLKYVITPADEANGILESAIYYGNFIQAIVDFVIIAFVVFVVVKFVNKMKSLAEAKEKEEAKPVEESKPTVEDLLTDIKVILEQK